jgi:hypothetical protein
VNLSILIYCNFQFDEAVKNMFNFPHSNLPLGALCFSGGKLIFRRLHSFENRYRARVIGENVLQCYSRRFAFIKIFYSRQKAARLRLLETALSYLCRVKRAGSAGRNFHPSPGAAREKRQF